MKGFVVYAEHEKDRSENVNQLLMSLPGIELSKAVYPAKEKIPFIKNIEAVSKERTGHKLQKGEIGCLMSHRIIWRKIIKTAETDTEHFMVLESDSVINDAVIFQNAFEKFTKQYDLFFWGAWDGHMQLLRSTRAVLDKKYFTGEPYIRSVYCTYGYSLNKKAAEYLLRQTRHVHHPVDQFKKYIEPGVVKIGGIQPEIISTSGMRSYIKQNINNRWYMRIVLKLLDAKNSFICLLK